MKDLHENVRDKAWRIAILEFLKRGAEALELIAMELKEMNREDKEKWTVREPKEKEDNSHQACP